MKQRVTLKEMVGTKIIYAGLIACYYWMWARRDWHDFYTAIQGVFITFTIIFFAIRASRIYRYGKQEKDERAIRSLRRADAIAFKILAAAVIIIAFASAVAFMDGRIAGYALVGMIFALSVIRFILFCAMNGKEI